ncbi:MAG TPA: hypothetical protein VGE52_09505 [Pirellulales bacterium]
MDAIYLWPSWALIVGMFVPMLIAGEVGYRLGVVHRETTTEAARNVGGAVKGAIYGLLALLIGFSYSLSTGRFDQRQRLMLDEANAIGTCYLRASLLNDPIKTQLRSALRDYNDQCIALHQQPFDGQAFQTASAAMSDQLDKIWASVAAHTRLDPDLTHVSQVIPAANQVVDLAEARLWAMRNHVPIVVPLILAMSAIITSGLTGHSFGEVGGRQPGLWLALNAMILLVLFAVADFDRPHRGLVRVDQTPFLDLREFMRR